MASTHTACHAVLNTTELLESILFQLPIQQVLCVQRASKQWQNTIARSPNLQVALFLKPFGGSAQSGGKSVDTADAKDHSSITTTPALINPLPRFATSELSWNGLTEVYLNIHDRSFSNLIRKHCKGSWQSMLLFQPAVYHVTVTCDPCYCLSWQCQHTFTISNSKGVTILNILMAARRHAELCQCGWHERPGQSSSLGTLEIDSKMAEMAVLLWGDETAAEILDKMADAEAKETE
ncbi:hypothetical protein HII31_10786 [Pseudocercospora fuligena]|uniref:F-box domain-containing protein n=1 Tax=Pseudocercospora fuligena TaxID=685502 RepID=A0A8H6RB56_9PEZI|nr:hypothetical protein HII31_10786 [Pseudocercospora fuligena]